MILRRTETTFWSVIAALITPVAPQLYEYAEAKARRNGAKVIRSGIGLCNRVSVQLHERLGFALYRYEFEKLLMDKNKGNT